MSALFAFASLLVWFGIGAMFRQRSRAARRMIPCAFCGAVVLTWVVMLVGRWAGVGLLQGTDTLLVIGIFMGGSAVGFPTRLAAGWRVRGMRGADVVRALLILAGFALTYGVLAGNAAAILLILTAVGIGAALVVPAMRPATHTAAPQRTFLDRLNHCCDESPV